MNLLEKKMVKLLEDLKENYNVLNVKAEFEAEGTRWEEALRLKDIVSASGLGLTIKIGGCEAIKDMYDAKLIGANTIVAPMIETSYAMKKYVGAIKRVFDENEKSDTKFLMNIETYTGYINLKSMIELPEFDYIDGIVLGRADMTGSMDMSKTEVDSDKIADIAKSISFYMQKFNKSMIIGGGITPKTISFLKQIPYLTNFETRKIIFDAQKVLSENNFDKCISKAVEFERMWLQNKNNYYGMLHKEGESRLQVLESRFEKTFSENT